MKKVCCLILLFWASWSYAQGLFRLPADKPLSFKFELVNHLILVPVTINGVEFSFLLDTGVKETILFANTEDSLYLNNQNKVKFQGLGIEERIDGIVSTGNIVEVGGTVVDSLHWLYVVQGEDLDISSSVGVGINGILGSRFFSSFPIKVDYVKSRITIYPPGYDYSREVQRYESIPVEIMADRPYIRGNIQIDTQWVEGKLLLDMGNTDPFMLFAFLLPDVEIKEPYVEEYIGRGFNGVIYGKRNRVRKASLHGIELNYPIVAYPDSNAVYMARLLSGRIGSVGNQTLQRFHVLMDYERSRFYLKKNKYFRKPFLLNMAGLDLKHDGMIWTQEVVAADVPKSEQRGLNPPNQGVTINLTNDRFQYKFVLKPSYVVAGIRKGSPAALAGVQKGDVLMKVNGTYVSNLTLAKILGKLRTKPGDEVRLLLQRKGEEFHVRFRLIDPIPYNP